MKKAQLEQTVKAQGAQIRALQQALARLTGHSGEITVERFLRAVDEKDEFVQDLYWQQRGYPTG